MKEVEHLFLLVFLKLEMTYSGEAPSFTQYKPKIKQINFLNDIRNFI